MFGVSGRVSGLSLFSIRFRRWRERERELTRRTMVLVLVLIVEGFDAACWLGLGWAAGEVGVGIWQSEPNQSTSPPRLLSSRLLDTILDASRPSHPPLFPSLTIPLPLSSHLSQLSLASPSTLPSSPEPILDHAHLLLPSPPPPHLHQPKTTPVSKQTSLVTLKLPLPPNPSMERTITRTTSIRRTMVSRERESWTDGTGRRRRKRKKKSWKIRVGSGIDR